MSHEYENMRRVVYGESDATFVPVCEKCGRFVKAYKVIYFSYGTGLANRPNAKCRRCGPTKMLFEGFV